MLHFSLPKFDNRRWWFVLGVIVTCGILLQLIGYNHGFPYIEGHDEARKFWNAYVARIGRPDMLNTPGYSPGLSWVHGVVQPIAEYVTGRPAELDQWVTINLMRLISIGVNAVSAIFIALIGRLLINQWAGWLAAFMWITASHIFEHTALSMTEPWLVLGYILAFWLSILALRDRNPRYAIGSVAAGLATVIFKYSAFPALGLGVGATAWLILGDKNKKLWLRTFAIQWGLIILTAFYLIVIYGASDMSGHPETNAFLSGRFDMLLDPAWWQRIFASATAQLNIALPTALLLIALGTFCHFLLSEEWQRIGWLLAIILWFSHNALILLYLVYHIGIPRYVSSSSGFLAILLFGSLIQIGRVAMRYTHPQMKWAVIVAIIAILGYQWIPSHLNNSLRYVQERSKPHTGGALSTWALNMIDQEAGVVIDLSVSVSERNHAVFERSAGGWQGKWMDIRFQEITKEPIPDLQRDGYGYFFDDSDEYIHHPDLLLLKQFPPVGQEGQWQGWPVYFYRIGRMQHETDVLFNDAIRLVGYDLSASQATAGDTLRFTPYWQAPQQPQANYSMYLHLYPIASRDVLAQADGAPVSNTRLTPTWDDPHETLIGQIFTLNLPSDLPAGDYRLALGIYDYQTGQRLLTPEGADYTSVTTLTVGGA